MSKYTAGTVEKLTKNTNGIRTSKFSVVTDLSKQGDILGVTVETTGGVKKRFPSDKGLLKAWDKAEAYLSSILLGNKKASNHSKTRKKGH